MSGRGLLAEAAAALAAGDVARAEAASRAALERRPDHPAALNMLAIALHRRGLPAEAEAAARRAIARSDGFADGWNTLGLILRGVGQRPAALDSFRAAIVRDPAFRQAWINLVDTLDAMGRTEETCEALRAALASLPDDAALSGRLGRALLVAGDLPDGERLLRRAAALAPADDAIRVDLATAVALHGRYDEAIAILSALGETPGQPALINLAVLHRDLGRHEAALGWIDRAVAAGPRDALARFTRAGILMRLGRLAEGWEEMEWRWRRLDRKSVQRRSARPPWDGAPLVGRRLLVWCEQGVGDAILHASMLGDLRAMADTVRVEADPRLVPLFTRSFPWAEIRPAVVDGGSDPGIDFQIPAGSLGRFLRPTRASFGDPAAFLRADPAAAAALRTRYCAAAGGRPVVGLSWRSTASRFKSAVLADWGPILVQPCHFVSLQYGETAVDIEAAAAATGVRIAVDPSVDPVVDLDAFAAQVAAMDLVVTTSNTTAHVAGALGVPCWVMVPKGRGALWYWFDGEVRSRWYRSVRLFHQEEMFDWAATIRRVGAALAQPSEGWTA